MVSWEIKNILFYSNVILSIAIYDKKGGMYDTIR